MQSRVHSQRSAHQTPALLWRPVRWQMPTHILLRSLNFLLSNAGRSRRTSCEACAKSKIKCDLEQPCSKCVSRGRECVYINDPLATKAKQSKQSSTSQPSPPMSDTTAVSSDSHQSYLETPPSLVDDTGSLSPASSFQSSLSPQPESSVNHAIEVLDPETLSFGSHHHHPHHHHEQSGFHFDHSAVSLDFLFPQPGVDDNCNNQPTCVDADGVNVDSFGQMGYMSMTPTASYSSTASSPVVPTSAFPSQQSAASFPPPPTASFPPPPQEEEANLFSSNWSSQACPPGRSEDIKARIPEGLAMCQEKSRYCKYIFRARLYGAPLTFDGNQLTCFSRRIFHIIRSCIRPLGRRMESLGFC